MKKIAIPLLIFFLSYFTQGFGEGEIKSTTSQRLTYIKTNSMGFKEYRNEKDGSILIEIPAGKFTMGTNVGSKAYSDYHGRHNETPAHIVYLDKYYIGKYEVTNAQYKKYCDATGQSYPHYSLDGMPGYLEENPKNPVVNITWADAKAYCKWAGLRLPTEAEWEKAARGEDTPFLNVRSPVGTEVERKDNAHGTDIRKYPWGKDWDDTKCNSSESGDGYEYTSPVGSFPSGVSPYGAYDMAGNVWEWCNDWYGDYSTSPASNPTGQSSGKPRVLRGGSWTNDGSLCRSAYRHFCREDNRVSNYPNYGFKYLPDHGDENYGFRPAK